MLCKHRDHVLVLTSSDVNMRPNGEFKGLIVCLAVSTVFENAEAIEGKCSFSFLSNNFDKETQRSSQCDDSTLFIEKFMNNFEECPFVICLSVC